MAAKKRGMFDCLFCRTPHPKTDADVLAMIQARVEKKDPEAMNCLGDQYYKGYLGLQKDLRQALELFREAAELGSIAALFNLGVVYSRGDGVEQDSEKAAEFYKKAAMQGHVESRTNLGNHVGRKGNYDLAAKHFLISAKMGHDNSLENIKTLFMGGFATKEQYADALRGYQDAVDETTSHDREEARALRNS